MVLIADAACDFSVRMQNAACAIMSGMAGRPSKIEPYAERVEYLLGQGYRPPQILELIKAQGYTGSLRPIQYLASSVGASRSEVFPPVVSIAPLDGVSDFDRHVSAHGGNYRDAYFASKAGVEFERHQAMTMRRMADARQLVPIAVLTTLRDDVMKAVQDTLGPAMQARLGSYGVPTEEANRIYDSAWRAMDAAMLKAGEQFPR